MFTFSNRKCMRCGKKFVVGTGGFVLKPSDHRCPACGSTLTIPWFS